MQEVVKKSALKVLVKIGDEVNNSSSDGYLQLIDGIGNTRDDLKPEGAPSKHSSKTDFDKAKGRAWQSRFCVLGGGTIPKLDTFINEDLWKSNGRSKTIFLQDIKAVRRGSDKTKEEAHVFEVTSEVESNKPIDSTLFAAASQQEADDWIEQITKLLNTVPSLPKSSMPPTLAIPTHRAENSQTGSTDTNCMVGKHNIFLATVQASEGAQKCGLSTEKSYILQVTPLNLLLLEILNGNRKKLLAWPYKYIRRYGRSTHSFTFEAGRKCESGEGLFNFTVEDGEKVFREVHLCTKAMKSRTTDTGKSSISSMSTSPPTPSTLVMTTPPTTPSSPDSAMLPPVPKRNYRDMNECKQPPHEEKESPKMPEREKPKKPDLLHNIKDALKVPLKTIGDQISESLHKHRASSEDVSPINSMEDDVHASIGDVGTVGKYTSSPNMRQRGLPPIPTTADENSNVKKTHKRENSGTVEHNNDSKTNVERTTSPSPKIATRGLPAIPTGDRKLSNISEKDKKKSHPLKKTAEENIYQNPDDKEVCRTDSGRQHVYSLYDDSSNQAVGDMYEEKTQQDSGISEYMLSSGTPMMPSAAGAKSQVTMTSSLDDGYYGDTVEDDGHYSSIDEEKSPMNTEDYSDPRTFKMSDLLAQAKTQNQQGKEQEDYSTTYSQDYDSLDILKSVDKGGHIRPVSNEVSEEDSHTYGVLSLGPKRGKAVKGEVDYMNTSANRK